MSRIHIILAVVAAIQCAVVTAWGCPGCFGIAPPEPTLADEVTVARDVAVAGVTGEPGTLEIQMVIKGDAALKGSRVKAPGINGAGRIILCRTAADAPWKSVGASGIQLAGFFKVVLGLPTTKPATDAEWIERLAHFQPYLGHPDPRLARSALMEWARAPYSVLKSQQADGAKLRDWLINPAHCDAQQIANVVQTALGHSGVGSQFNEPVKIGRPAPAAQTP